MNIRTWFSKDRRPRPPMGEQAAALTVADRRNLEVGGSTDLSAATVARMQTDAMVATALAVKRNAVLAAPWKIVPASESPDDRARAEMAQEALDRLEGSPLAILDAAMQAFADGWSVQELVWDEGADGRLWLRAVRSKDPSVFGLKSDRFGVVRELVLRIPGEAEKTLPRGKFVVWAHRRRYGRPQGTSDLLAAHPHWRAKLALAEAWRWHLERFASPTVLGRYDAAVPPEARTQFVQDFADLSRRTVVTFPKDFELETLGGDRGASTGYQEALEFHNREIARAILGQTLTTDEGRRVGSLALGKVHLQVLLLQVEAIRRDLAETVMTEQVLRPVVEANLGPGPLPRFEFQPARLDAFVEGKV